MSGAIEKVAFWTTGEFVTDTSRDWFWAENRPYHKVEEFLLCCMCGTDLPKSTLLSFIRDILMGRRRFIGNTLDGSYGMVDDDTDMRERYRNVRILFSLEEMERYLEAHIRNQEYDEKREAVKSFEQDDYGWVSPKGEFYPVPWARHQEWAHEYIIEHFSSDERSTFYKEYVKNSWDRAGDFLQSHGWVLLHHPHQLAAQMTRHETKPLTKAQREFLYDYFMLRSREKEANSLFKEGE